MGFFNSTPAPKSKLPFRIDLELFMLLEIASKDGSLSMKELVNLRAIIKAIGATFEFSDQDYQIANKILNGEIKSETTYEANTLEYYNFIKNHNMISNKEAKEVFLNPFITIAKEIAKIDRTALQEKMALINFARSIFNLNHDEDIIELPFHLEDLCFMLYQLASSDGNVSNAENEGFESFIEGISESFNLSDKEKGKVDEILMGMIKSNKTFEFHASQYYNFYKDKPDMLELALKLTDMFAQYDGITPEIKVQLNKVKEIFNMNVDEEDSELPSPLVDLCYILQKIAASDGEISESETKILVPLINSFTKDLDLSEAEIEKMNQILNGSIKSEKDIEFHANRFYKISKGKPELIEMTIKLFNMLVAADGNISAEEMTLINKVKDIFKSNNEDRGKENISSTKVETTINDQKNNILEDNNRENTGSDNISSNVPKFCSNCGSNLKANSKFCSGCGHKILVGIK